MSLRDLDDASYLARIRNIVLIDTAADEKGDEVFVIKHRGETSDPYYDIASALDDAATKAKRTGCNWDLTIQARNAADMS